MFYILYPKLLIANTLTVLLCKYNTLTVKGFPLTSDSLIGQIKWSPSKNCHWGTCQKELCRMAKLRHGIAVTRPFDDKIRLLLISHSAGFFNFVGICLLISPNQNFVNLILFRFVYTFRLQYLFVVLYWQFGVLLWGKSVRKKANRTHLIANRSARLRVFSFLSCMKTVFLPRVQLILLKPAAFTSVSKNICILKSSVLLASDGLFTLESWLCTWLTHSPFYL